MSSTYIVHARDEGRHRAYEVEAAGFVDAASTFVERWLPDTALETGEVSILVEDTGTGERHCLTIDLESGEAGSCD
jgi:hypothetical protein